MTNEPPAFDQQSLRARREELRRRQTRRRRLAGGLIAIVAVAVIAVIALGGPGKSSRRAGHATKAPKGRAPKGRRSSASAGTGTPRTQDQVIALRRLAKLAKPVYCGGRRGRYVALTFDDGPGPYTTLAMRKLRAAHAQATWFLVAKSISSYPHIARREVSLGAIGDHTLTHPFLPGLSQSAMANEISGGKRAAEKASGTKVRLFRPPYGARNSAIDRQARKDGLVEVLWSMDSRDSLGANYAGIAKNVKTGLRPGAIILMHENRGQTIRAMRTFLPALRRKHLRAVTVSELLTRDPPSAAQLRVGPKGCGGGRSGA
ncbi:MAG TPA: polysaccharide deacetylase family protein [Solirubrobacteraceae bacterium]|nr:polysaccharide deacetylase family protein [Solirubrobacteraceae bacterium]